MNIYEILRDFDGKDFDYMKAGEFQDLVCSIFSKYGKTEKEVFAQKTNGKKGRIDLTFEINNEKWGIELDRKSPRWKSMDKLRGLKDCTSIYVIIRSPFNIIKL